jgi:toxin ParE1/3/4
MRRVILAPEADADLWDIVLHIAKRNPPAAYRFIDIVYEKAELLASHPEIGLQRDELEPGLRSFPVGAFVLFYRPRKGGIEVARILRGSRDIPSLF